MVVEKATSNACECHLQYQSRTSAVSQFDGFKFACLQMTLPIVYQQVVAFVTIILLVTGYCNYFHDSNTSPPNSHKSSDHNISRIVFVGDNVSVGHPYLKLANWTPDHLNGKYTTIPALTDVHPAKSKYGQQPVSCLDGLPKLITEMYQICLDES